ncbi:MAG TPA: DNA alkylation repair protein [Polyangiales bacterium]|nr:DNA alkylation repair protein [Polyangiales bacterium]
MAAKKSTARDAPPSAAEVIATLERMASKSIRDGMGRYGIPSDRALGISVGALRGLGKKLGKSHALALALWASEIYEARLLAAFVGEADQLTSAQMDRMCRDFDNWAVCDTMAFALFDRSPHAFGRVKAWSARKPEFEKRAAFALLASLALHDKSANSDAFLKTLPLIERAASDPRNFVKKGVSWALRSVGARNLELYRASVELAAKLAKSADASERWVGKDALRDLSRPMVQKKLKARAARSK